MKKFNYSFFYMFILFVCFFICIPQIACASTKEVIVGVYDNKPMIFMDKSGPAGLFIDLLENIAKKEDWKLIYHYGKWSDVFDQLKSKRIDILPVVAFKVSRKKNIDYTAETLLTNFGQVYKRKGLQLDSIQDLSGKTIATQPNDSHGIFFKNLLDNLGIQYENLIIENYIDILEALNSQACDAGVVNHINAKVNSIKFDITPTPIVFNPIQIRYAVPKGDPANLLLYLDKHISTFKKDKNSIYHQSMEKWFGAGSTQYIFPKWGKWMLAGILGAIIILFVGNLLLRVQVKIKNKEILGELEKRKQAEEVLMQSEEKYRKLISNISDVIVIMDKDGVVRYKSPNITKQFGWRPEDLIGKHSLHTTHPDDKERIRNQLSDLLKTEHKRVSVEYKYLCKDGSSKPIELTAVNMLSDPVINGILANYKDITKRKKSERILKQSEAKYRTMIERSNDMIWTLDQQGNFIFFNKQTERVTGMNMNDWIGKSFVPFIMEEDLPRITKIFQRSLNGESIQYELRFKKQDDDILTISVNTAPIFKKGEVEGIVSFGRNITEQRKLESSLQQSHKMEAIGTLAGGIAHDFNNILSGIFGYSQLAEMNINNPERAKSDIKNIVKGASRATELVQQILTFSRKADYEKQYLNLFVIVKEVLKLIRSTIPATITIKEKINSKASIYADPIQMHQVIMNLCTNAYHAMGDSGGELTVRLDETHMPLLNDESMINVDQKYLELEISDTGHGIDENTMKKIFDPYFTTKSMEKGTGLGLALVTAIVEEHSGTIKVNSIVSKGSTFLLHFPMSEKKKNTNNENNFEKKIPTGTESILFVDDEMDIRSFVKDFLSQYGYAVTVSENGQKAYEKFRQAPQNFDIIITDMAMPKMSGEELSLKIIEIRKDIPILLCTGYTEKLNKKQAKEMGITRYIEKPLAGKDLCFLIREVMDEAKNTL